MPTKILLPKSLPTKFWLLENKRINPTPVVGISVYVLGDGVLLSKVNMAYRISAKPARLTD